MKKIPFAAKPQKATADDWVNSRPTPSALGTEEPSRTETVRTETMKRLTIDVSASLHRRIKIHCAQREIKIADEVRRLLEQHFPDGAGDEE